MAAKKWKLASLHVKLESSFATDPDADGSDYLFLKTLPDMTFQPSKDVIERPGNTFDLVRQAHKMGAKSGTLSFKTELKGSGTVAADGVAAIAAESDQILQALFGTVTRGTGSIVVSAGSTVNVVNVSTGDGAGFTKYMMAIFNCGATYGYVARFITGISTDALTLDRALPAVPANGAAVYASSMYTRANTGHSSLAFVAKRGQSTSIEYTFLGCKIDTAKITGIAARGTAILEVTCSVTDWVATTKGSLAGTSLTGITAVKAPVIKGSCFAVGGTEELIYALDFDFAFKFDFQDATCALGTAQPDSVNAGLELTEAMPGGSAKAYTNTQHLVDFFAGNEIAVAFSAVDQGVPGVSWGLYAPKAQYTGDSYEEHSGMMGESLPFKINDNSTDAEFVLCLG